MPSTEEIALIGAGGLVAAEALGVTNMVGDDGQIRPPQFIPIPGGGGGSTPIPIPSGGSGIPEGLLSGLGGQGLSDAMLAALTQGGLGGGGSFELLTDMQSRIEELRGRVEELTQGNIGPTDFSDITQFGPNYGPGGVNTGGGGGGGGGNGDPFDNPAPGIQLGDVPALVSFLGEGTGATGSSAGGFIAENPYATGFTALGAISPDPITTGLGASVGVSTEVASDFLTGGTPLGVQSPANFLSPDTYATAAGQAGDVAGGIGGAIVDTALAGAGVGAAASNAGANITRDVAYGTAGAAGDVVAGTGEAIFGPAFDQGSGGDPRTAVDQAEGLATPVAGGALNLADQIVGNSTPSPGQGGTVTSERSASPNDGRAERLRDLRQRGAF